MCQLFLTPLSWIHGGIQTAWPSVVRWGQATSYGQWVTRRSDVYCSQGVALDCQSETLLPSATVTGNARPAVPDLLGTRDGLRGRHFFHRPGLGGMVQAVTWAMGSDGERAAAEAPLTLPRLTSCCAARFLTGHGPVPVHGPGGPLSYTTAAPPSLSWSEDSTEQTREPKHDGQHMPEREMTLMILRAEVWLSLQYQLVYPDQPCPRIKNKNGKGNSLFMEASWGSIFRRIICLVLLWSRVRLPEEVKSGAQVIFKNSSNPMNPQLSSFSLE